MACWFLEYLSDEGLFQEPAPKKKKGAAKKTQPSLAPTPEVEIADLDPALKRYLERQELARKHGKEALREFLLRLHSADQ